MAIDTAAKRFSMMDFDMPWQPGVPPPDGLFGASDRMRLLWLYSGASESRSATGFRGSLQGGSARSNMQGNVRRG